MWKLLFDEKRIEILHTPIVIARKGKDVKRYYSLEDYTFEKSILGGYSIEYNKGLGSLSVDEYEKAVKNPVVSVVSYTDACDGKITLAFGKDSQVRKDWLLS
jgi:DNA topoisomerase-2